MFDRDAMYTVLDAHFVNHLVRPGEEEQEGGADGAPQADMPDNMLDDLLDELDEVLQELTDEYGSVPNGLTAVAFGFIDGVMAQANGSYSTYEDAYFEDRNNERFAQLDQDIAAYAREYDGNRDWGESAMGYLRHVVEAEGESAAEREDVIWQAQGKGYVNGADLSEDYEWKLLQDESGNIVLSDADAIEEFTMRKLDLNSGGGLLGRISGALGVDLGELESALGDLADGEESEDADEEFVDIYDAERNLTGEARPREGLFLNEGEYMLYALALIENDRGAYLITQRSFDKSWGAGWWEVSGGGVLSGETSQQAIVREVAEETGLDVSDEKLVPVYSYENVDLERGDNYIVDIYHFHVSADEGDVTLQESEAVDFRFATWDEIAALAEKGEFLHYERLRQALEAEGK